mmetsp:Transcript_4181/g.7119  ORF Transcript_4181/g.7119 Transcript_4181/m.7119 type:complete len:87 (-) Transcript_4181:801-1061(-)
MDSLQFNKESMCQKPTKSKYAEYKNKTNFEEINQMNQKKQSGRDIKLSKNETRENQNVQQKERRIQGTQTNKKQNNRIKKFTASQV